MARNCQILSTIYFVPLLGTLSEMILFTNKGLFEVQNERIVYFMIVDGIQSKFRDLIGKMASYFLEDAIHCDSIETGWYAH